MTYTHQDAELVELGEVPAGFGPVVAVDALEDVGAVQIELAETAPLTVLQNWAAVIDVVDTTVGVYDASDEYVRLHVRGLLDEIGPVVITQPLHRTRRPRQAQTAWEQISDYSVGDLLERLSEMD